MAVVVDGTTATVKEAGGVTTLTVSNLTVGSGSNRALLAMASFEQSAVPAGLTAVWDSGGTNQSMTPVPNTNTGTNGGLSSSAVFFGLLAPTSGNKSLVISWTGALGAHAVAMSFTGVNQTSVAVAFPNGAFTANNTSTASPISKVITSAIGNIVAAYAIEQSSPWGAINGTTIASSAAGPNDAVAANYNTGAATVTPSFAFTGPGVWAIIATDILAAGGGAAVAVPYNPWLLLAPILSQ